jgi:plastocyanin
MSFSPALAALKAGQTVAWRNADAIVHDMAQDGGGFDTGRVSPGATSAPIKISAAGQIAYHCTIHPGMVGALSVTQ